MKKEEKVKLENSPLESSILNQLEEKELEDKVKLENSPLESSILNQIEEQEILPETSEDELKEEKEEDTLDVEKTSTRDIQVEIFKDEPIIDIPVEIFEDDPIRISREEKNADLAQPEKKELTKKQKVQIVVSILVILLVLVVIVFLFLNKENKKKESSHSNENIEEISYQEILNEYAAKYEENISNYQLENGKLPTVEEMANDSIETEHQIVCETTEISTIGKVYLAGCSIDGSEETYSYGEKEEAVVGNELTIYKGKTFDYEYYTFYQYDDFQEVITIPCKNQEDTCAGYLAYSNYAAIIQEDNIYIYSYEDNEYIDTAFVLETNLLEWNNVLYALAYTKNNKNYLYSLAAGKTFSNIAGELYYGNDFYPLGYVPYYTDTQTNFINLKTGKIAFNIPGSISYTQDEETGEIYILSYLDNQETSEFYIYNSKGTELLGGQKAKLFYVSNGKIVITTSDETFKVYNSKYKLIYTSKEYTEVLSIGKDCLLVLDDTELNLVDYEGNVLTTFIDNWDDDKYYLAYQESDTDILSFTIGGEDVNTDEVLANYPDLTKKDLKYYDLGYQYYYDISTKESGRNAVIIY